MDIHNLQRRLLKAGCDVSDVHVYHTVYLTVMVDGIRQQLEAKFAEKSWNYDSVHDALIRRIKVIEKETRKKSQE